jgi:hypothetical protein
MDSHDEFARRHFSGAASLAGLNLGLLPDSASGSRPVIGRGSPGQQALRRKKD